MNTSGYRTVLPVQFRHYPKDVTGLQGSLSQMLEGYRREGQLLADVVMEIARNSSPFGFLSFNQLAAQRGNRILCELSCCDIRHHANSPVQFAILIEESAPGLLDPN